MSRADNLLDRAWRTHYSPRVAAEFDESDFVDSDRHTARQSAYAAPPIAAAHRAPTREELDAQASETRQRLEDLRRQQEELERERLALEEARRRREEFHTSRDEMQQHLTRGVGLLEDAEFVARRDAEQMARTLSDLRDHLARVQALSDETWTQENYAVELTRALTALENARMEWNAARLKWPLLDPATPVAQPAASPPEQVADVLRSLRWSRLWKVGLALTWPLVVVALLALGAFLLLHLLR